MKTRRKPKKFITNKSLLKRKISLALLVLGILILVIALFAKATNDSQELKEEHTEIEEGIVEDYEDEEIEVNEPEINARSLLFVRDNEEIFSKESDLKLPIASLTKLMTALIVLDNYDLNETIVITERAFLRDFSRTSGFFVGEKYTVKDLLHPLLMESSNATAYALAQRLRELPDEEEYRDNLNNFIYSMNQRAKSLGMNDTYFINPCGLDPSSNQTANYSTAQDLLLLAREVANYPLILEITSLPSFNLSRLDGFVKHRIVNTNVLLSEIPGIIGGKTGTTARAQQCLLLITDQEEILVILGSQDRFGEARKLFNSVER